MRLRLRIGDAGQIGEEVLLGIDGDQVHALVLLEGLDDLLRLALAQQAVVDKDAGQPVADGAMDQRRRHRAVDAAAQPADDVALFARPGRGCVRPSPG